MSGSKLSKKEKLYTVLYIISILLLIKLFTSTNLAVVRFADLIRPFLYMYGIYVSINSIGNSKTTPSKIFWIVVLIIFAVTIFDTMRVYSSIIRTFLK